MLDTAAGYPWWTLSPLPSFETAGSPEWYVTSSLPPVIETVSTESTTTDVFDAKIAIAEYTDAGRPTRTKLDLVERAREDRLELDGL